MSVNKITLKTEGFGNEPFFNIPINLSGVGANNTDAIETEFVKKELERLTPEVDDNEMVRYTYKPFNDSDITSMIVNINLTKNGTNPTTYLSDIGLTYDDLKYRRKRFRYSFLRVEAFDSPNIRTQKKLGEFTVYLNLIKEWFTTFQNITNNNMTGSILPMTQCRLRVKSFDPVKYLNNYNEGYNIYLERKYAGTDYSTGNFVYMRFTFNNAVTGIGHRLGKAQNAKPLDELVNDIHIKCMLYQDENGVFRYEYKDNITNGANTSLQLYECIAT